MVTACANSVRAQNRTQLLHEKIGHQVLQAWVEIILNDSDRRTTMDTEEFACNCRIFRQQSVLHEYPHWYPSDLRKSHPFDRLFDLPYRRMLKKDHIGIRFT